MADEQIRLTTPELSPQQKTSIEKYVRAASDVAAAAQATGDLTPNSVAATGTVTGSNLSGTHTGNSSGTNTGDETKTTIDTKIGVDGVTTTSFYRKDGTWGVPPAGTGTVTSVSVTTANGVSGSVANASTTPAITLTLGAITPSSVATSGAITSSGTAGMGYASGAGGTVTQATSKATAVTLNKLCGEITMNGAALAASTVVSFVMTNSTIAATDNIIVNHVATGTFGGYSLNGRCNAGSATIDVRNLTGGSLSEAIKLRFTVIKAATS